MPESLRLFKKCGTSFPEVRTTWVFIKNSQNTIRYGKEITYNIATWVAEGYAAGLFEGPPCPHFHVNLLLAVVQPGKVRPVLDVSSSKEDSFNSMVDDYETKTVKIASTKKFG